MKLQDQVCTRRQGNDLRALGITNSLFCWMRNTANEWVVHRPHQPAFPDEYADDWAPAFTVAELGVVLPAGCGSYYNDHFGHWEAEFVEPHDEAEEPDITPYPTEGWKLTAKSDGEEETEAEARAALLIHLLETGKITADEVNARLQS